MTAWDINPSRKETLPEGTHRVLNPGEALSEEYWWIQREYHASAPRTPRRNEVNRRTRNILRGEEGRT